MPKNKNNTNATGRANGYKNNQRTVDSSSLRHHGPTPTIKTKKPIHHSFRRPIHQMGGNYTDTQSKRKNSRTDIPLTQNDDEIELQDTDKWTDHLRRLQTLRDEVQRHLIEANEKQAHYYNLRRRDIQFKEGDRVLKKNHTLSYGLERTAAKRKRQHGRQTTKNTGPNDTTTNETDDNNNGHTNKQRKNSTTTNTRTSPTPTQIRTRRYTPDRDPTNSTTDTHYTHTSNKKRHDSNTDHNHRTHNHPETPTNTHTNDHTHSHTLRTNAMPKVQWAGPGHKILTTHTDLHTNKHRHTTPTNSHPNYTNHNHAHDDTPTHQQTNTPHNHTPHIDTNTSTHTTPRITPFMDTHQTHETTDNRR
ncbi:GATA zinc finger domain-containing protein 14-like [Neodiprion pinetum]|uniref:GATA zinc finger domain-containing protein 14-like n=1 Tax=Neodiprion pinetum TaxID=441929 RepID=UPI003722BCE5